MKKLQELTKQINDITLEIEQDYPELYKYLDENPVSIPCCETPKLDIKSFTDYMDSLKELLQHHIETHKKEKND